MANDHRVKMAKKLHADRNVSIDEICLTLKIQIDLVSLPFVMNHYASIARFNVGTLDIFIGTKAL